MVSRLLLRLMLIIVDCLCSSCQMFVYIVWIFLIMQIGSLVVQSYSLCSHLDKTNHSRNHTFCVQFGHSISTSEKSYVEISRYTVHGCVHNQLGFNAKLSSSAWIDKFD